jgi:N-ethylmaleimide reductase
MSTLFSSLKLGRLTLRNRILMAPMTRSRADDATGVPSPMTALYYAQRAGAGMIVTEGVFPSAMGKGYVRTPGIATADQRAAWKNIVDAVHTRGGLIALQLMHTGRISHPSMLPEQALPVAPSAVRPAGQSFTAAGPADFVTPRALDTTEVEAVIAEYAAAARAAIDAGFDGVELHAASGYLPEQFLSSNTNLRDDRYGGSLPNRARFILDTLTAMSEAIGSDRVGVKISPEMGFNDIHDADPVQTYRYLVGELNGLDLAYLYVAGAKSPVDYHALLRPLYRGTYLLGGGQTKESGEQRVGAGEADAVFFGSAFLANPDLPERFMRNAPLNAPNPALFYAPGAAGYLDYPAMPTSEDSQRALRLHAYDQADALRLDAVAASPAPGAGEVLVKVRAAGVNGLDGKIRDGMVRDVFNLPLPAVLGLELAGEVMSTGPGVDGFTPGQRVLAALGGLGAYADSVIVAAARLVAVPDGLDDVSAAALPVSALTAWQALFEAGALQPGETLLVHGAAGGVGSMAVQFARRAGVRVLVTARAGNAERLRGLGADEVIDYRAARFEQEVSDVDLVLDLVGGETLDRSWPVLSARGRIVSTAAPDIAARAPEGRRGSWFVMRPDAAQLADFAGQAARGELKVVIDAVADIADAPAAIERNKRGHGAGKSVLWL